jgi:hypothetical protein
MRDSGTGATSLPDGCNSSDSTVPDLRTETPAFDGNERFLLATHSSNVRSLGEGRS